MMEEYGEQLLLLSESIGEMVQRMNKAMNEFISSDSFKQLKEIILNIPEDIQDTVLFRDILSLEKKEITYDDAINLQNEFGCRSFMESVNLIKEKDQKSELDEYMVSVIDMKEVSEKNKLILLLVHFEALIFQTMGYERQAYDKVKDNVSRSVKREHDMETKSIAGLFPAGIVYIVFTNTDSYQSDIDKRLPFRNYILHRGIIDYSDVEAKEAYEILVSFIAMLVRVEKVI